MIVDVLIEKLQKLPKNTKLLFTEEEKEESIAEFLNGENKIILVCDFKIVRDQNNHSIFAVVPADFEPKEPI